MGTEDDRAASALDDLLQRAVKQGYLDPMAGLAARSGVDRLRTFLTTAGSEGRGAGAAPSPAEPAGGVEDAEVVAVEEPPVPAAQEAAPLEEAAVDEGAPTGGVAPGADTVRIPVVLRGGRRAELVLPARFDEADAARVSSVLHALALDEDPGAAPHAT
ncbi:hypothetical protein CLV92_104140 [Kineococcus xinjiangensis]|uniref:Uncharacterized protein n=1 Tax=Kineococcus xinjiangensis TaxID=512762 RepID=A0A2S6IT16_9ACTN|nr:hypothetical protein [Kineococcus xinjiangensis]PPK97320.1 hypothetical protein CLV92_104140 [Kineococcus xinjiangensis]